MPSAQLSRTTIQTDPVFRQKWKRPALVSIVTTIVRLHPPSGSAAQLALSRSPHKRTLLPLCEHRQHCTQHTDSLPRDDGGRRACQGVKGPLPHLAMDLRDVSLSSNFRRKYIRQKYRVGRGMCLIISLYWECRLILLTQEHTS